MDFYNSFVYAFDKSNEETKDCKKCRYYLGIQYVEIDGVSEAVECCVNIILSDPNAKLPCEIYKVCPFWEDKDSVDELRLALDKL